MPHSCVVPKCSSNRQGTSASDSDSIPKQSISRFRFPIRNPKLMSLWLENLPRKDFEVKSHHRICSQHFEDKWFEVQNGRRVLKVDAVPTVFGNVEPARLSEKLKRIKAQNREFMRGESSQVPASKRLCNTKRLVLESTSIQSSVSLKTEDEVISNFSNSVEVAINQSPDKGNVQRGGYTSSPLSDHSYLCVVPDKPTVSYAASTLSDHSYLCVVPDEQTVSYTPSPLPDHSYLCVVPDKPTVNYTPATLPDHSYLCVVPEEPTVSYTPSAVSDHSYLCVVPQKKSPTPVVDHVPPSVTLSDHTYLCPSPDKPTLMRKLKKARDHNFQLRKKLKLERAKNRRNQAKISSLKNALNMLIKNGLENEHGANSINNSFGDVLLDLVSEI